MEPVDVIVACTLMSPGAYSVDYHADPLGEDVGWSLAVKRSVTRSWIYLPARSTAHDYQPGRFAEVRMTDGLWETCSGAVGRSLRAVRSATVGS